MAITSLRDNRKNEIIPKNPFEVSIGTKSRPLNRIEASNIYLAGQVNTRELIINGYVFDKNHLFIQDVNSDTRNFYNLIASNIDVKNSITAETFDGSGNNLKLDNIKHSLYPGSATIDIGGEYRRFNNIYAQYINGLQFEGAFKGDGSLLTNIPVNLPDFQNFHNDIIPVDDYMYDVGSELRRFKNVYAKNFISSSKIQTRQIRITNDTFPEDLEEIISIANEYVRHLEYDITDDIIQKMGNIDLQVNTSITGISYTVESIMRHAIIQDTIYPKNNRDGFIGSPSNIFSELHVVHPFFYGTISTCNVTSDIIEAKEVHADNFIGSGEYIDNITHFGKLLSNVEPLYDKDVNIGREDLRFKNIYADVINASKLKIDGSIGFKEDVKGILVLDTEHVYMLYSPLRCVHHTLDYFTERVDLLNCSIHVSRSGMYTVSLFGISSNRNILLDNNIVWYIHHYNRSIRAGSTKRVEGQTSVSIVLAKLDSIKIFIDPLKNVPLKFKSGIVIISQDTELSMIDNYFDV